MTAAAVDPLAGDDPPAAAAPAPVRASGGDAAEVSLVAEAIALSSWMRGMMPTSRFLSSVTASGASASALGANRSDSGVSTETLSRPSAVSYTHLTLPTTPYV